MSAIRRIIAGVSGSPRSLPALRYAATLARDHDAVLIPLLTWAPPGGALADCRYPSKYLHREWERAAWQRLDDAIRAAFGGMLDEVQTEPVVACGEPGWMLVHAAGLPGTCWSSAPAVAAGWACGGPRGQPLLPGPGELPGPGGPALSAGPASGAWPARLGVPAPWPDPAGPDRSGRQLDAPGCRARRDVRKCCDQDHNHEQISRELPWGSGRRCREEAPRSRGRPAGGPARESGAAVYDRSGDPAQPAVRRAGG